MSWGAQNRSKDAKTPSAGRGMSEKPEPGLWPIQPYYRTTGEAAQCSVCPPKTHGDVIPPTAEARQQPPSCCRSRGRPSRRHQPEQDQLDSTEPKHGRVVDVVERGSAGCAQKAPPCAPLLALGLEGVLGESGTQLPGFLQFRAPPLCWAAAPPPHTPPTPPPHPPHPLHSSYLPLSLVADRTYTPLCAASC
jgi:hypothetical protein